jgi:hypothetical protein
VLLPAPPALRLGRRRLVLLLLLLLTVAGLALQQ